MKNFIKDFEKFNIKPEDYPKYSDPEKFARNFKRCTIYEYGNISHSNNSTMNQKEKVKHNA